jgi:hypothetical protein
VSAENNCQVLRKRPHIHACRLQILQQLKPTDEVRQYELLLKLPGKLDDYYKIVSKLVVSDEAMYHLSEQDNRRNLRVWDSEDSHENERDSQNIKVFVSMLRKDLYWPFFS